MIDIGMTTQEWALQNKIPSWFSPETTSTNNIAKEQGFKDDPLWIYVTNHQTEGRGRHSNSWLNGDFNPEQKSKNIGGQLLVSWCLKLNTAPQPISSAVFGWAVYKSLNDEFDLNLSVKAPNDIYIDSKKCAGILLESVSQGNKHFICIGIGLNVFTHPNSLQHTTNLCEDSKIEISKERWFRFLNALKINLNEAGHFCQNQEIPSVVQSELLLALKKWPENHITKISPSGDLTVQLENEEPELILVPWTEL